MYSNKTSGCTRKIWVSWMRWWFVDLFNGWTFDQKKTRHDSCVFGFARFFHIEFVRVEPEVIVSRFRTVLIFRVRARIVQTMHRSDVTFKRKKLRNDKRRNVVFKQTLRHLHKQSTKSTVQHKSSTGIIIINIVVIYRICSQIPIWLGFAAN